MRFFLIFAFIGISLCAAQEQRNLAVLDFEGTPEITKDQLQTMSDRLQAEIVSLGGVAVMERRNIDVVMQEQSFIQSGACNTDQCHVQLGQLLGVDVVVVGKVVPFGKTWVSHLRIIHVGTGTIERVIAFEVDGELIDVLRYGSKMGAEAVVNHILARPVQDFYSARDYFREKENSKEVVKPIEPPVKHDVHATVFAPMRQKGVLSAKLDSNGCIETLLGSITQFKIKDCLISAKDSLGLEGDRATVQILRDSVAMEILTTLISEKELEELNNSHAMYSIWSYFAIVISTAIALFVFVSN